MQSQMKPWAQWLINNNLKFVVYLWFITVLPLFYVISLPDYLSRTYNDIVHSFRIINQAKKETE